MPWRPNWRPNRTFLRYPMSGGLNLVTGSLAPSQHRPRCRPRPSVYPFHRSGVRSANGNLVGRGIAQLGKQLFRRDQIGGVKPFCELIIDWLQQRPRLDRTTLITQ
jgi:hypothetical protein